MKPTFGFLAVGSGVLVAVITQISSLHWLLAGLASIAFGLAGFIRKRRLNPVLIFICFFIGGGFWFSLSREGHQAELKYNRPFFGKIIVLEGAPVERPIATRYGYRFIFQVYSTKHGGPVGRISVNSRDPLPDAWYGRKLRLYGRFKAASDNDQTLPGFFERKRITGALSILEPPKLLKGYGLPFPYLWADRCRRTLISQGLKVLKPANASLLHGMIFNDSVNDSSNAEVVGDMRRTGTIHLLSVSGLHIGFIVLGINFLLGWLRFPKKWRIAPLTLVICFYILMTGMNPPVLRAGIMMLLFYFGEMLGTADNNVNRLSLAALLLLLINPYNLFEIGFQLSFLGTLGVVWIYPLLKEYLPLNPELHAKFPVLNSLWQGTLVSVGAQSLITPVIIGYFQLISWSSPLVNIILLIPAEIIVIGGIVGEILGAVAPFLGWIILTGVGWVIDLTRLVLDFFGGQFWSFSWVPSWPWPWIAGYYLGLVLFLDWLRPNRLTRKRMINAGGIVIVILAGLNAAIWFQYFEKQESAHFQLSCLDVGQGDAIFLKTPDGFTILVDGGDEGRGNWSILPFLRQRGIRRLDLAIGTHGHKDHLGGLAEVLAEVPVARLLLPPQTTPYMESFLRNLGKINIQRVDAAKGLTLKLGKSAMADIFYTPDPDSENNQSLVMLVHYRKNKLLLTGDLGFESEEILIRKYPVILQASVLKVAHHGSNLSTGLSFLTQVKPQVALISAGKGNQFGHPGPKTLRRLNSLGIRTYRTDRDGRIDLRIKGDRLQVFTQK